MTLDHGIERAAWTRLLDRASEPYRSTASCSAWVT